MTFTRSKAHVRRVNHPRYKWLVTYRAEGKLRKKYFNRRDDADTFADTWQGEAEATGTEERIYSDERSAILELRGELERVGLTVRAALEMAIERQQNLVRSASVATLIKEHVAAKRQARRSDRYLDDLDHRLGRFVKDFGELPVAGIESHEIADWLAGLKQGPVSTNNYRRLLVGLFNDGIKRRYCEHNPATTTPKAKEIDAAPGILRPDELHRLLSSADPRILPAIAVGAFAGLRPAELQRQDWKDIRLSEGFIEVRATTSKTARRRLIKIQPALHSWIATHAKAEGPLWPKNGRKHFDAARQAAGIDPWPNDALRHSFASYHLAAFKDAAALALEMGHESTRLIFKSYREVVTQAEADRYWGVFPAGNQTPMDRLQVTRFPIGSHEFSSNVSE
jgi:integrase